MRTLSTILAILLFSILLLPNVLLADEKYIDPDFSGFSTNIGKFSGFATKLEVDSTLDAIYYDLDMNIDPINIWATGTMEIVFGSRRDGMNTIAFKLGGDSLIIHSVMDGADSLNWTFHSNENIEVNLNNILSTGEQDTIIIDFETDTDFDRYPFKGYSSVINPDVSFGVGGLRGAYWLPNLNCILPERLETHFTFTVPDSYVVVGQGELVETIYNPDSTISYVWDSNPTEPPLINAWLSYSCGKYIHHTDYANIDGDTIPVSMFTLSGHSDYISEYAAMCVDALEFFSDIYSPYPWGKLDFAPTSAMESPTLIILNRYYDTPPMNFRDIEVHSHEISHQWWGLLLRPLNQDDDWIAEGMAQYSETLYLEYINVPNVDEYEWESWRNSYFDYLDVGGTDYPLHSDDANLFGLQAWMVYDKGPWVARSLSYVLSDSVWFDCLHTMIDTFANKPIEIEDFWETCEEVSGRDLDWFFDEWFDGIGYPKYEYSWYVSDITTKENYTIEFIVEQVQAGQTFTMPLDVSFITETDTFNYNVWVDSTHKEFTFNLSDVPQNVELDSDEWVLCEKEYLGNVSPKIIDAIPSEGATEQDINSAVYLFFSNEMDTSYMNETYIQLIGSVSGDIPTDIIYYEGVYSLGITPLVPYNADETITVWLSGDIQNIYNLSLDSNDNYLMEGSPNDDYTLHFATGSTDIELSSFLAYANKDNIILEWKADKYTNIYRSTDKENWIKINQKPLLINNYIDRQIKDNALYYYRLELISESSSIHSQILSVSIAKPDTHTLLANYPNPFNAYTIIPYQLASQSSVKLSIYNLSGELVNVLVEDEQNVGNYSYVWDGTNRDGRIVPSGVYYCRLNVMTGDEEYSKVRRLVLLK